MAKIVFNTVKNGNTLSTINSNFASIANELQNKVLYRDNPVGEPNAVIDNIDLNGTDILNGGTINADHLIIDGVNFEDNIATAIAQVDALVLEAEGFADDAAASAVLAQNQVPLATTQANNASTSATQAAASVVAAQLIEDEIDAKLADIAMGPVISVAGMGGIVSTAALKTALAIENVDNTHDIDKPVSSAVAAAISAALAAVAPVGMLGWMSQSSAPAGWVVGNGGTIGSAASGATVRANADTQTLFILWWNQHSNTILPIQDSAGVATTRGASALDDFNANKRLPTFDVRDEFIRGASATVPLGTKQTSANLAHTHTGTTATNAGQDHTHTFSGTTSGDSVDHTHQGQFASSVVGVTPGGNSISVINGANQATSGISTAHTHSFSGTTGGISATHNHTFTTESDGTTESRPRNLALLGCFKL